MAFNISRFKANALPFGGARPTLFEVTISNPPGIALNQSAKEKFTFTCRSAQLPASSLGTIEIPYFGRKIKLAGDRVFQSWQVSVMNDEDFLVRRMLEDWSTILNTHESNLRLRDNELAYKADIQVFQYSKEGEILRSYVLEGAYPSVVSPIALDWNSTDQIETFDVTFEYDYWMSGDALRVDGGVGR